MKPVLAGIPLVAIAVALSLSATAQKPPPDAPSPRAIQNTQDAFSQTSAVVEATVSKVEYTTLGRYPWTVVHLTEVVAHRGQLGKAGERAPRELTLRQVGGFREDGRQLVFTTVAPLVEKERYLIFLRNTSWSMSPIVGGLALRLSEEAGAQVLVGPGQGFLIEDAAGNLTFSEPAFTEIDLNGQPSRRNEAVKAPVGTVNVARLLSLVDEDLKARGASLTGAFYDEPVGPFSDDTPIEDIERQPGEKDVQPTASEDIQK